ncbi:MAG: cytochrome c [Nitrospira sp.]|nr:cytochrome c [Nitrospira sp.]
MAEALSYKAPFGAARAAPPDIVAKGKTLYEGKGQCALCHGVSGKGDGPAAHMHGIHPPRNFSDCTFQKEREDGELFWVIKNGSPNTGMISLIPSMLTEDEGWKIVAYLRTFCSA